MTGTADLQLCAHGRLPGWNRPLDAGWLPDCREVHGESPVLTDTPAIGPGHVSRSRAMAGFAADIDFLPAGFISILLRLVTFHQCGGVAAGAARIPVLEGAGPVQWIVMRHRFIRIEVVPALTTFAGGTRVPAD